MTKSSERRRFKRVPVRIPAKIYVKGWEDALEAEVRDISEGGAFIQCDQDIPDGDPVLLELKFAELELLHGIIKPIQISTPDGKKETSVIRWIKKIDMRGFGVEFVDLRPEARDFIRELVEHILEKNPDL